MRRGEHMHDFMASPCASLGSCRNGSGPCAPSIGAATPVQIGSPPDLTEPKKPQKKADDGKGDATPDEASGVAPREVMGKKQVNDAAAYIRGLALRWHFRSLPRRIDFRLSHMVGMDQ